MTFDKSQRQIFLGIVLVISITLNFLVTWPVGYLIGFALFLIAFVWSAKRPVPDFRKLRL